MSTERMQMGHLKCLEAINRKLYRVELWLLNEKVNRNNWQYTNIAAHIDDVMDIPVLTAYVNNKVGDGHNYDVRYDENGNPYASFTAPDAERIVGWIPKNSNIRIQQDKDGVDWLVADALLWQWYAPELTELIVSEGEMDVSIETLVSKEHYVGDVAVEDEYTIIGVTVLGKGVQPAVEGAKIQNLAALDALRGSMKEEILKAASYMQENDNAEDVVEDIGSGVENKEPNKNNTKGVKPIMALSKKQLAELTAKFNGYTCVGATEDLKVMALLSADNTPCGYAVEDSDMGNIVEERINSVAATVTFRVNDTDVSVPLDSVLEKVMSDLSAMTEKANNAEANVQTLTDELTKAHNRESARRLQAAKDAVTAELNRNNENRAEDEHFSADICKDLMAKIENNEFTALEDAEGNWIGESAVRKEVSFLCNEERIRMDAEAKAKEKHFVNFNGDMNMSKKNKEPMTLGEKLNSFNKD